MDWGMEIIQACSKSVPFLASFPICPVTCFISFNPPIIPAQVLRKPRIRMFKILPRYIDDIHAKFFRVTAHATGYAALWVLLHNQADVNVAPVRGFPAGETPEYAKFFIWDVVSVNQPDRFFQLPVKIVPQRLYHGTPPAFHSLY